MTPLLIHQLYAGIAPWAGLALVLLGRNPHPGMRRKVPAVLLAAFVLLFVPIGGWSAAAWLRALEPNPSFTLTGLLLVALATRLTGKTFFRARDWHATWIFGAVASLVLYPMGLGLTQVDPHCWGWMPLLPIASATVASLLLLRGNRFGMVLILPFAGSILGVQESRNFWGALLDPFYAAVALVMTAYLVIRRCSPLTSPARVID